MIKINEIFYSIQGESTYAGNRTVFIRTTGCNLRCTYCDTKYSYHEGEFLSLEKILDVVKSHDAEYICITGGEPLLQPEIHKLINILCDQGHKVSLETSGSKSVKHVDPRVKIILDVKTPDSGAADSFLLENIDFSSEKHRIPTEYKFVISSEKDLEWSEQFCRQYDLFKNFTVLFSPSHGQVSEKWLAERILQKKLKVMLHLQQHKYIWLPTQRGV
ncbi:radical SAM protein [Pseudobdellovibrio exovorus]|uniref:7-carboxy-7-deazaguanine synthase n=1 Tax=Pseudobdellovibrio exovorus JSS TaxID=1184267 RepID=M4V8E1_9BACT|nr:radical SAM protein [Pseudobdellovibrio exovorus]AGH94271.1 radical activating enzyme [Pseudobdellovibrio exovorus JSS]